MYHNNNYGANYVNPLAKNNYGPTQQGGYYALDKGFHVPSNNVNVNRTYARKGSYVPTSSANANAPTSNANTAYVPNGNVNNNTYQAQNNNVNGSFRGGWTYTNRKGSNSRNNR